MNKELANAVLDDAIRRLGDIKSRYTLIVELRFFGGLSIEETAEALQKAGVRSVFYVSPDTAHEFLSWRRSLREFAPLLFRD